MTEEQNRVIRREAKELFLVVIEEKFDYGVPSTTEFQEIALGCLEATQIINKVLVQQLGPVEEDCYD